MNKRQRPHLVTGAGIDRQAEHKSRQRRYMLTMTTRLVLLIVAAIVARWSIPWAIAIGVVSTVIPGFAVVMANDGPPKSKREAKTVRGVPSERAIAAPAAYDPQRRVITADSVVIDENGATLRPKK